MNQISEAEQNKNALVDKLCFCQKSRICVIKMILWTLIFIVMWQKINCDLVCCWETN